MPAHDGYEYVRNENEPIDREKVLKALANVQNRIDNLINKTKKGSSRVDMKTYNKCAAAFASAFGIDNSSVALSEDDYNKLFGEMDVTEENYIQMCKEKRESLSNAYDNLEKCLSKSIDRIRSEPNGEERVKAIKNAFPKAYGRSFEDILELIEELQMVDETE